MTYVDIAWIYEAHGQCLVQMLNECVSSSRMIAIHTGRLNVTAWRLLFEVVAPYHFVSFETEIERLQLWTRFSRFFVAGETAAIAAAYLLCCVSLSWPFVRQSKELESARPGSTATGAANVCCFCCYLCLRFCISLISPPTHGFRWQQQPSPSTPAPHWRRSWWRWR